MVLGMSEQIAVRLTREQLAELDRFIAEGSYPSRAAFVRDAVDRLVCAEHERQIDLAIVEGYRRLPPTPIEQREAEVALREAIAEEPW